MSEVLAFTVAEAVQVSRVGKNALYDAIKGGELRVVRIGRRILVPRSALEEWLDTRSRTGLPSSA